jgi:hypothetical protein
MRWNAARTQSQEAARLEAIALRAGTALGCTHQSADELHRALVCDYLKRLDDRSIWARLRAMKMF